MKLIPLSKTGKFAGKYFAMVDDEMFDFLNKWNWTAQPHGQTAYAVRNITTKDGNRKSIRMHRFVAGISDSKIEIDHIDGNGLNNQKCNLRQANRIQNNRNTKSRIGSTSKYLGVSLKRGNNNKKWVAQINFENKKHHLGYFKDEIEAAKAYDKKAKELFGEFSNLNFK